MIIKSIIPVIFLLLTLMPAQGFCSESDPVQSALRFLRNIEWSSTYKFEYDNNIFLKENDEDGDFKHIFTQTMSYKKRLDDHFFQLGYKGNYSYYTYENTGVLAHGANLLYSYRPFNGFSIGIRDNFNWLQDSKITTTLADHFLSLGYVQNSPRLEMKYEINEQSVISLDTYYQFLDVRDKDSDDYIDNKKFGVRTKLEYDMDMFGGMTGFIGVEHNQIAFNQIYEKSSVSDRLFVGYLKKYANLFNYSAEIGYDHIDMDDGDDDNNVDARLTFETVFSIYTKMRLGLDLNVKKPSLRSEYAQYGSTRAYYSLNHSINPKLSMNLKYSFEDQDFNGVDALAGEPEIERKTKIHNIDLNLIRKLNKWLSCDFRYHYTQRDTDFAGENYTNHLYSIGLTGKY